MKCAECRFYNPSHKMVGECWIKLPAWLELDQDRRTRPFDGCDLGQPRPAETARETTVTTPTEYWGPGGGAPGYVAPPATGASSSSTTAQEGKP